MIKLVAMICFWCFPLMADVEKIQGVEIEVSQLVNGCLVAAVEVQAALLAHKDLSKVTWAHIFIAQGKDSAHAFCIFALKNGDMWAYDILHGSACLHTTSRESPMMVFLLNARYGNVLSGSFVDLH